MSLMSRLKKGMTIWKGQGGGQPWPVATGPGTSDASLGYIAGRGFLGTAGRLHEVQATWCVPWGQHGSHMGRGPGPACWAQTASPSPGSLRSPEAG